MITWLLFQHNDKLIYYFVHIPWLAGVPNEVVQRADSVFGGLAYQETSKMHDQWEISSKRQAVPGAWLTTQWHLMRKNIYAVLVDLGGTKSTNTLPCVLCSCLCPYLHQNMWKRSYWYEKLGLIYIFLVVSCRINRREKNKLGTILQQGFALICTKLY